MLDNKKFQIKVIKESGVFPEEHFDNIQKDLDTYIQSTLIEEKKKLKTTIFQVIKMDFNNSIEEFNISVEEGLKRVKNI